MVQARQGEILFQQVENWNSEKWEIEETNLIRVGNTGNFHLVVNGDIYKRGNSRVLVPKTEGGHLFICHSGPNAHPRMELPSGVYKIIVQQVYSPTGWRDVLD